MKKGKQEQAESKVLWITTILFIVFGAVLFGLFHLARTDAQSELAKKIRDLTGIKMLAESTPEPENDPFASAGPEPEPEPKPGVVEKPKRPQPSELEQIGWSTFRNRSDLWPATLEIKVDQEVPLTYHGRTYGEVNFNSGQTLDVIDFSEKGYIYGRVGGTEMAVQLSATDFERWFQKEHGDLYELGDPEQETIDPADDFEQELITQLRRWSLKSYQTPLIEVGKDNLILRWDSRSQGRTAVDYAQEAMSVARAYLRIQAELGGGDTYASCEIRDPKTGELLGAKGIFMPRF